MPFKTKIDFSNNRQINQTEQTTTSLFGRTDFGLPFSGLSSGPKYSTSATTAVYESIVSTFSGNNSTTNFNFGLGEMNSAHVYLNTITNVNFMDTQIVNPYFVGVNEYINPNVGNVVNEYYSGTSFDLTVTNFEEISPNIFTGSAISDLVNIYRAESFDYTGDGTWVKVNGLIDVERIKITDGASVGTVLTCIDNSGNTVWAPSSGGGGANPFIQGSSGTRSIKINFVSSTEATGNYAFALGFNNKVSGDYSMAQGFNNNVDGPNSFSLGISNTIAGTYGLTVGNANYSLYSYTLINGNDNDAFQEYNYILGETCSANSVFNLIFGKDNTLTDTAEYSAIIGGHDITGDTANTVYVPHLNITQLYSGASVSDIGINAQGFVVDILSDERLKENIKTIDGALDKILKLRGVTYNWIDKKSGGENLRIGFIAQEVNEIVPELVFENKDSYLGVHYDNITALLVEAIKELATKKEFTPVNSNDETGNIGDICFDNNYQYVKTNDGWKRSKLENF